MATPDEVVFAVRAPNWLGDAILATPAVGALAECSRRGPVVVLTSAPGAEVFSRLAGTKVFRIRRAGAGIRDSLRAIHTGSSILKGFRPVMVFSFTRSLTSAVICFLGGVPRRIGFADSVGARLYTDRVGRAHCGDMHLVESYCSLVESMGIRVVERTPRLVATGGDAARGKETLRHHALQSGGYVCLFPGARYGPAKRWDHSRFALLADILVDRFHKRIVLLGSRQDATACEAVAGVMRNGCLNLCGKLDFAGLIGLLVNSGATVSNDSGGMHLAAALGVPTVGLFFSSDPRWTGPLSSNSRALYNRIDCSPCFSRDCKRGHVCTRSITVDEVIGALEEVSGVAA
jgi:heptosyltransferase-2